MADAERKQGPGWGASPADADEPGATPPSETVSREELRKVIAERDGYKRRLRELQRHAEERADDAPGGGPADEAGRAGGRDESLRRQLAEKDRTIARLLIDTEIAEVAARLGAFDPKAITKLTRDLFVVKDGRVQLADGLEDGGLTRFDDQGRERTLADVVAEFLSLHSYLVRPTGAQGAGSRSSAAAVPANLRGLSPERYLRLSDAEKQAIRRMAGVPDRPKVW